MPCGYRYTFPAVRGVQAGREYYISMCPLNIIPKILLYDEEDVPPELRAQRTLNKSRIPTITKYIVENPDSYIFSALTASIDGDVQFEPLSRNRYEYQLGLLHVPMDSKFIINDGQHRRAAIEEAIKKRPELGDEMIGVVFFVDTGLSRAQQMFADLNRYAVRPSKSLSVLYDHRDPLSEAISLMVLESSFFNPLTDRHKSSLALRSKKLFTLSALRTATEELFKGIELDDTNHIRQIVDTFWHNIACHIPEWRAVSDKEKTAGYVREHFIHTYAVTLQALGRVGSFLLQNYIQDWKQRLTDLEAIDWSRNNPMWDGRPVVDGAIRHSAKIITLTTIVIKSKLGLPLTKEELAAEQIR